MEKFFNYTLNVFDNLLLLFFYIILIVIINSAIQYVITKLKLKININNSKYAVILLLIAAIIEYCIIKILMII